MHTKEEVELFLPTRGDGMTLREAAAFAGVGMGAAKRWSAGDLPRSYTGRPWGSGSESTPIPLTLPHAATAAPFRFLASNSSGLRWPSAECVRTRS